MPVPGTAAVTEVQSRRARYRRGAPEPMRLTDDDLAVLRFIAKYRFLRSTHLVRLLPGRSPKKLIERLGALYHNQFVDRPRAQLDYYATAGSAPMVYALGNHGAAVLAEHDGLARAHVDWTWKNREVGRVFLEHTLMIADVMVAAEVAVLARPDVKLIEPHEILEKAPAATRAMRNPFLFKARVRHDGAWHDLAVVPDRVFGLDFTAERKRSYVFLEADRGTMPVMRASLAQTSVHRKLLAYAAGGAPENLFGKQLGVGSFRVLVVAQSAERQASIATALVSAVPPGNLRQFLFVTIEAAVTARDLLALPLLTGKAEPTLLDGRAVSHQQAIT